jgi:hypothetical protein
MDEKGGKVTNETAKTGRPQRDLGRDLKEKDELIGSLLDQIRIRDDKLRAAGLLDATTLLPAAPAAPPLQFDGKNGLKVSLSKPIAAPFTLSCRLLSLKAEEDEFAYTETSPPMPLLVGRFALYRVDNDVMRMNMVENSKIVSLDFQDSDWTDVVLQVGEQSAKLIVNGREIGEFKTPADTSFTVLGLGCGFLDRGWKGQYEYVVLTAGLDAPPAERGTAEWINDSGVLFYFDGNTVRKS